MIKAAWTLESLNVASECQDMSWTPVDLSWHKLKSRVR